MTTLISEDERPTTTSDSNFKRVFTTPLLRYTEMASKMKTEVIKLVTDACETCKGNNQSTAQSIKELLDDLYGGSWHVVVGEQFGVEVTHETGYILYMFFGTDKAICVWRCA